MGNEGINAGQLLKQANRFKREGRLDEAIALYHQVIELSPNFAWAYNNLGDVLVRQGKLDEAIAFYYQSLKINPNSSWLHSSLGEALAKQGDLEGAIEYIQKAVEIRPDYHKFHHRLDQILNQKTFNSQTLEELHLQHTGKVSDKWSSYLGIYNQILKSYRNKNVRLLEIGVQNGGSLEIWAKYFSNAKLIVGCDINPQCGTLNYDNSKIHLLVGDANSYEVQNKVVELSKSFDIIIDDGSHYSSDIIKSFSRYFPLLEDGGVYIIVKLLDAHQFY